MGNLGTVFGLILMFWSLMIVTSIAIYIVVAIFLNKFNKLVYGKETFMAWLPVFNVYLLGKLTVNKIVGWILVACIFLRGFFTTPYNEIEVSEGVTASINGVPTSRIILFRNISTAISIIYSLAVIGLLIYAIIKYNKLKKSGTVAMQQPQQPIQPVVNNQQLQQQAPQTNQPIMNGQPLTSQAQQPVQPVINNQQMQSQPQQTNNQN